MTPIIEEALAYIQNHINALQAQLDKIEAEEREWPQIRDAYWVIDPWGGVIDYPWQNMACDRKALQNGSAFRTEAEATQERDRRALIAELRRHPKACGFRHGARNWHLCHDKGSWRMVVAYQSNHCPASGFFSDAVEELIEQYGSRLDLLRGA